MIEDLFTWLSQLVESTPLIAFAGAFLWGILSILLSPCHLSSIPLIIGFIGSQGKLSTKHAFRISIAFSLGILLTIGFIGIVTSLLGRMLGDIGDWSKYLVAAVFVLVGLYLIGVINIPLPGFSGIKQKQRGAWAAFLLGLVFGIALGPCTFAYLAPIIAVAFSASSNDPLFGTLLLLFYGIGHCLVFVIAGTFTRWIQRYLDWTERSKGNVMMKRICGVLVIAGAIYMLTV